MDKTNKINFKNVIEVVSVLVGTIVGAGFATGNEIYQFFARFGNFGYVLVCVFFVGMFAFTFKIMHLANKFQAFSLDELSKKVFGEKFAFIVNSVIYISFFVFASVMMSAMESVAGVVGVVLMVVLGFVFCVKERQGILIANQFILPLVFVYLFLLCLNGVSLPSNVSFSAWQVLGVFGVFYYIALNELISLGAILVVLHKCNKKELVLSSILGCLILSLMIVSVMAILNNYQFAIIHMPLKDVANLIGGFFPAFSIVVLFCTIFTTFLSSIFGLYKKIKITFRYPILVFSIAILFCYLLSFLGFSNLIQYAYNVVGFVALFVSLCFLFAKR